MAQSFFTGARIVNNDLPRAVQLRIHWDPAALSACNIDIRNHHNLMRKSYVTQS